MRYLSRLILDLRQRAVQQDLADCHRLHDRMMQAFPAAPRPDNARAHFGVLFRTEPLGDLPLVRLLVQSQHAPDWTTLPARYLGPPPDARGNPAVHLLDTDYARIAAGMRLRFRLRANPTKRVSERNDAQDAIWRGKRIELRREEDQIAWLERKGSAGGFRLLNVQIAGDQQIPNVRVSDSPKQRGRRGARRLSFGVAVFDGLLAVTDSAVFVQTLDNGIGSAKAFGFGLLSIAQAAPEVAA
jgi:CRISPR system Cascade subunit CasE